jgi:hypothetical protein
MQRHDSPLAALQRSRDYSPSVPLAGLRNVASSVSVHLHGRPTETKTAADFRGTIIKGNECWFLTGATNDPDNIEIVVRIGWFQIP